MKQERQIEIAAAFPSQFAEADIDISLNSQELEVLSKGIFARAMEDKWNLFVIDEFLYLSRSWTGYCIYKVSIKKRVRGATLQELKVSRNYEQYTSKDLKVDIDRFKRILQSFLKREDLFIDARLSLPLIKEIIENLEDKDAMHKNVGSQSVELNIKILNLNRRSRHFHLEAVGLDELNQKLKCLEPSSTVLSLHIANKENPKDATTYYFNQEGTELLGQVTIKRINKIS